MDVIQHTIWLAPNEILNANQAYSHWGNRSGPAKLLRARGNVDKRLLPRFERVRIDAVASYVDRRKRDVQNLYPTMKSYVDGLVDNEGNGTQALGKGILPDDNDTYLSGPFLHWSGMLSDRRKEGLARFDLTFTPIPDVMPKSKEGIHEWNPENLPTLVAF